MYALPTYVEVNGKKYNIRQRGDYRIILDCFDTLNDVELSEDERVLASLLIFYNEFEDIEDLPTDEETFVGLVQQMYWFMNVGSEDEAAGAHSDYTIIDWKHDENMITSAINKVAGQEIRLVEYMHWWTFMGHFSAVGESMLATVVGIRSKIAKHEKLEKWEEKFKKDNPNYFIWRNVDLRVEEQQALLAEVWNVGR